MLTNPRIDDHVLCRQMLQMFIRGGQRLVIAIDWTEWHNDLRMLLASVVVGRRAVPVYAAAFDKRRIPRSQNSRENTFLRVLTEGPGSRRLCFWPTVASVA